MPKKLFLLALAALLSACGFHLRGQATLPFESLFVQSPPGSTFTAELKRVLRAGSATRIVENPADAQATLQIITELREKQILSLSGTGRVREFQLRYRVSFQVTDAKGRAWVAPSEVLLRRDFSFNDSQALAKETEEAQLYRDMQTDAVQQLLRKLALAKPLA